MYRQILRCAGLALTLIGSLILIADPAAAQQPGGVRAWGLNSSGQLGNGLLDSSTLPVTSWYAFPVTNIAAGGYHSLAVTKTGTVLA
jgi:alpha-tubulin suppressor-like RCC1 family protein